jgi:hypothetical protein
VAASGARRKRKPVASPRSMSIALRVVAIALWGVVMIGMASWSNTDAAMIGAGIGTVVLGVLVGRWWVLLVPIVPRALLALGTLVSDPDDYYEGSPGLWAAFVALWTVGIAALLALGVAVNRSMARVARFRTRRRWRKHPERVASA